MVDSEEQRGILEQQLECKNNELTTLLEQFEAAKSTLIKQQEEISEKQVELEQLQSTLQSLQFEKETLQSTAQEEKQKLEREKKEWMEQQQGQINQAETQLRKSEELLQQFRDQLEEEKSRADTLERKTEELTKLLASKEEELVSANESLLTEKEVLVAGEEQMKRDVSLLEEEREGLKEQLHRLEQVHQEREMEFQRAQHSIAELDQTRGKLVKELELAKMEAAAVKEAEARVSLERETLRGRLNQLTETNRTFSEDSAKQREQVLSLEGQFQRVTEQKQAQEKELGRVRSRLVALEEEVKVERAKGEELARYQKETSQLKSQFESAMSKMEEQNSQLKKDLAQARREAAQKTQVVDSLQEQIAAEGERSASLQEENRRCLGELRTTRERLEGAQREAVRLQQQVGGLSMEKEQLRVSVDTLISEKESLLKEHELTQQGVQSHESRIFELTNQVTVLARGKEEVEERCRQLQRELAVREREALAHQGELEMLRGQLGGMADWNKEREVPAYFVAMPAVDSLPPSPPTLFLPSYCSQPKQNRTRRLPC